MELHEDPPNRSDGALQQLIELSSNKIEDPQLRNDHFQAVMKELLLNREKEVELKAERRMQQKLEEERREGQKRQDALLEDMKEILQKGQARQDLLMERLEKQQAHHDEALAAEREEQKMLVGKLFTQQEEYNAVLLEMQSGGIGRLRKAVPAAVELTGREGETKGEMTEVEMLREELKREREESRRREETLVSKMKEQQELFVGRIEAARGVEVGKMVEEEAEEDAWESRAMISSTKSILKQQEEAKRAAHKLYANRSNNAEKNKFNINNIVKANPAFFAPILDRNPNFSTMMAHMFVLRFGVRVGGVDWTKKMTDWDDEDNRKVGRAMAPIMRMVQTGDAAVGAWRSHYPQLNTLFDEVTGFEVFMNTIAMCLLRDNKYGVLFRVSCGASLSVMDGVTDIYTTYNYYNRGLQGQAFVLLVMLLSNILVQLLFALLQARNKSWRVKVTEALITIFFLRHGVDAYRVATAHEEDDAAVSNLTAMIVTKSIELGTESIPGGIFQTHVFLRNPGLGATALTSIAVSAMCVGYTSATIWFDLDADVHRRRRQTKFYGILPDDNSRRGNCFIIMTLICALHNISRTVGVALLTETDKMLPVKFIGGEMALYLLVKIVRGDFIWWPRIEGFDVPASSLLSRVIVKLVVDFSGCLHFRHPYEMGGLMFTMSVVWSQAMPFVALLLYAGDDDTRSNITIGLIVSITLWLLLVLKFFCSIDLDFLHTFTSTKTAPQYVQDLFLTSEFDLEKFDAAFTTQESYTRAIKAEVRAWVAANIEEWKRKKFDWFKLEMIPDEFLPRDLLEAEGGAKRRRSSVSIREMTGGGLEGGSVPVFPPPGDESIALVPAINDPEVNEAKEAWRKIAEEVYAVRSKNYKSNLLHVRRVFSENAERVAPLVALCPKFELILCHILVDKFGFRVKKVDWTSRMKDWSIDACTRVGCSLACFIRNRKTADVAVDSWRLHYTQLNDLFTNIVGFEEFIVTIARNTLRDSVYGTVYRVSIGAALSMLDAMTDISVVTDYYRKGLRSRANALLAMIALNLIFQLLIVSLQEKKKTIGVKLKEAFITLTFLRPAVDAYRVSTNVEDSEAGLAMPLLYVMGINKCLELACESIPGLVLQLIVFLSNPADASGFALVSIGISALTTGYTSANLSLDFELDVDSRKAQPTYYGYMPDDSGKRFRCFLLLTMVSALHNLSRSVGVTLLAISDGGGQLVALFMGGEMVLYFLFKIVRRDWWHFVSVDGIALYVITPIIRFFVKIIVDFSGCIQLRHPNELGGAAFAATMLWSQVMPFVALWMFEEKEDEEGTKRTIMIALIGIALLWAVLIIAFFCNIDLSYLGTFFGTKTAPQHTCDNFFLVPDDASRFFNVFLNNLKHTRAIRPQVKQWVAENIERWKREGEEWFVIGFIPDDFLPGEVLEAEGGAKRRRSSVSLREIVGLDAKGGKSSASSAIHPI